MWRILSPYISFKVVFRRCDCSIFQTIPRIMVPSSTSGILMKSGHFYSSTVNDNSSTTKNATESLRSRLLYQSRKRGTLENDLLLSTFADKYLATFNLKELNEYDLLINQASSDEWDLYYWLTSKKKIPEKLAQMKVMKMMVEHAKNKDREKRIKMPQIKLMNKK